MSKTELKPRMMQDEMAEVFVEANPGFFPTKQAVGRYAKKLGYRRVKQNIDKKQVYFYIKNQNNA